MVDNIGRRYIMPTINKNDDNYIYYWVGKNIKKYRKLKGWSQSKLA